MSKRKLESKICTSLFRVTTADEASSLTDGAELRNDVILPWVGYGTYKLGKQNARECTLEALRQGYRAIDTAFIYGGETTETQVGLALQDALSENILKKREDVVIVTKHWRKYHGYEPTMECLRLSLKRLQVDYVDVWLIHWPGPAYTTMSRRKDVLEKEGPWHYAAAGKEDMPGIRSDTWRAMEDALKEGKVKAIGVSNFTVKHLESLKKTAKVWPPAVNQIEVHPLYPQKDILEYCQKEGIVVQAYASLGGQDTGKKFWKTIYKREKKEQPAVTKLLDAPPVVELANEVKKTPAQVLLRWALQKSCAVVPKTATPSRMLENAQIFDFSLPAASVEKMEGELTIAVELAAGEEQQDSISMGRLCWKNDPMRLLDFD